MNITLNVYDKNGQEIAKTYTSSTYDIMFGTVMKLMELLKIEDMTNQMEMLKTIYQAWDEIKVVLSGVFPEVTEEDWECVKVKELLPIIVNIAKFAVSDMFVIPTDGKKN